MFFALLLLLAPSVFAQCGVGSQCKTKGGDETCSTCCTPCPAGTACSQWTTSSGGLGAFYCQYTTCLAEGAFCNVSLFSFFLFSLFFVLCSLFFVLCSLFFVLCIFCCQYTNCLA